VEGSGLQHSTLSRLYSWNFVALLDAVWLLNVNFDDNISGWYLFSCGPGSSVGIATDYGLDGPGIESRWWRDFPPVQTGPGAHPASCTMGTGSFPGVKCGRGVLLTTHLLLAPRSWKGRAIPLPPLWATIRPVTGLLYLYVSGSHVPIIRRINCINTTFGICHYVYMTVWCVGLHQTIIYTEWHIPDVVLIQLILLMMGTWLPETCRE